MDEKKSRTLARIITARLSDLFMTRLQLAHRSGISVARIANILDGITVADEEDAVSMMMAVGYAPSEVDCKLSLAPGTAHDAKIAVWKRGR